jgi:diguanylate cyclase (GGDEF)-like protein
MVEVFSLDPASLERFLGRQRARPPHLPLELSLSENLIEILQKANQFVPSEAGSILLDDPLEKGPDRAQNRLTFLAVFGEKAASLVGQSRPARSGIGGLVYRTGRPYITSNAEEDEHFDPSVDAETRYQTRSMVAIPIRIGKEVCGVLELINRLGAPSFSERDRQLLEIFAEYIAISIQNVLDGKLALEYAKRDNLTGLYNDRYLHSVLETSIQRALPSRGALSVLFVDLDFFKLVNDIHGHLAGSQVLRDVGQLLRRVVEEPPGLIARYGGDEFVVVLDGLRLEEASALAERIRSAIAQAVFCDQPGEIQPEPLHLGGMTCSIGVASLELVDSHAESTAARSLLLRLADAAMYRAKEGGRNRVVVADPERDRPVVCDPRALTPSKGS